MRTRLLTLKHHRRQLGLKQQQCADYLGCSKAFYSQMERGVNTINLENALLIARMFNMTIEELFLNDFNILQSKRKKEADKKKYYRDSK